MDDGMAEEGLGRIGTDAGQVLVHPHSQISEEHRVVAIDGHRRAWGSSGARVG
jgi:hypothetical protein